MKRFTIIIAACLVVSQIFSQAGNLSYADSLFRGKNWAAAATAYKKITTDNPNPKTGITFNRLGTSYYYQEKFQEAVPAFRRAIEISKNPTVMYSLACVFNRLNKKDSCYAWLNRAVKKGFDQYQQIMIDEDLSNLKGELQFEEIVHTVKVNAMPCLGLPEYRQLDFWIGKWKVYDTKSNRIAGSSEIVNLLGECVIMENWQPIAGPAGKSFNMYNAVEKKWRQTYVDASGTFSEYYNGEFLDNTMHFSLKPPSDDKTLTKMSFYKKTNDEVQQVGQVSKDNGQTWETIFDLTYKRE